MSIIQKRGVPSKHRTTRKRLRVNCIPTLRNRNTTHICDAVAQQCSLFRFKCRERIPSSDMSRQVLDGAGADDYTTLEVS